MQILEKTENFLAKAVQIGVALVLFLPLIMLQYFAIAPTDETSKVLVFQCIIEVVFLIYVWLVLLNKNYLPKKSWFLLAFCLFFVLEIISGVLGANFYASLFGNLSRGDGIVLHLHYLAFFLVLTSIYKEKKEWFKLLRTTSVVGVACSALALLMKIMAWLPGRWPERLSGTLINPGIFGNYIALSVFLIALAVLNEKNKKLRILWCLGLALNLYVLFFSGTRGAWAGLVAGLFFIAIFFFINLKWLNHKKIFFAFVVLLTIVFAGFFFMDFTKNVNEDNLIITRARSFLSFNLDQTRKVLWKTAVGSFLERPVLGWGGNNFGFYWDGHAKGNDFPDEYESAFDKPHNKVLEVASANGTAGLLAYFAIFFIIFLMLWKHRQSRESWVLAGFFVCYFVENLFLFDSVPVFVLFLMATGFVNNNFGKLDQEAPIPKKIENLLLPKIILAVFLLIFTGIIFYNLNLKTALAGMYFKSGEQSGAREPLGALYAYPRVLSQNSVFDYYYKTLILSRLNVILESNPPKEIKDKIFAFFYEMEPDLQKYINGNGEQKNRFFSYMAKIYKSLYLFNKDKENLDKMEKIIAKAVEFNNKFPVFYLDMARLKIMQGKNKEALEYAENFYKLTPQKPIDGIKMHLALAQSYLEINDFKNGLPQAEKVLDINYNLKKSNQDWLSLPNFTNAVILICIKQDEAQKARDICQKAMEIYPERNEMWQQRLSEINK